MSIACLLSLFKKEPNLISGRPLAHRHRQVEAELASLAVVARSRLRARRLPVTLRDAVDRRRAALALRVAAVDVAALAHVEVQLGDAALRGCLLPAVMAVPFFPIHSERLIFFRCRIFRVLSSPGSELVTVS